MTGVVLEQSQRRFRVNETMRVLRGVGPIDRFFCDHARRSIVAAEVVHVREHREHRHGELVDIGARQFRSSRCMLERDAEVVGEKSRA